MTKLYERYNLNAKLAKKLETLIIEAYNARSNDLFEKRDVVGLEGLKRDTQVLVEKFRGKDKINIFIRKIDDRILIIPFYVKMDEVKSLLNELPAYPRNIHQLTRYERLVYVYLFKLEMFNTACTIHSCSHPRMVNRSRLLGGEFYAGNEIDPRDLMGDEYNAVGEKLLKVDKQLEFAYMGLFNEQASREFEIPKVRGLPFEPLQLMSSVGLVVYTVEDSGDDIVTLKLSETDYCVCCVTEIRGEALFCDSCTDVKYCSVECREQYRETHSAMCNCLPFGSRVCNACDTIITATAHKCALCRCVSYCSKACQKRDWNDDHKFFCRLLGY